MVSGFPVNASDIFGQFSARGKNGELPEPGEGHHIPQGVDSDQIGKQLFSSPERGPCVSALF